jgi:hypothetical protein
MVLSERGKPPEHWVEASARHEPNASAYSTRQPPAGVAGPDGLAATTAPVGGGPLVVVVVVVVGVVDVVVVDVVVVAVVPVPLPPLLG